MQPVSPLSQSLGSVSDDESNQSAEVARGHFDFVPPLLDDYANDSRPSQETQRPVQIEKMDEEEKKEIDTFLDGASHQYLD